MTSKEDKQHYHTERYKKRLNEWREAYKDRKDYVREFTLLNAVGAILRALGGGGEDIEEVASGGASGGSVVLNGDMPTIDQYVGPDVFNHELISGPYQAGIKGKLAGTDQWNADIKEQAAKAGVNPIFAKIIMAVESGGKHSSSVTAYNCVGLMQVKGETVKGMGLDWNKCINDAKYNIYAGCMVMRSKFDEIPGIRQRAKNNFTNFKAKGYELKHNLHGTAWLYNGFSVPSAGSSKVTSGGICYADQVAAMYKGFGRDAHKDGLYDTDVLGGSDKKSESKDPEKAKKDLNGTGAGGALAIYKTYEVTGSGDSMQAPRGDLTEEEEMLMRIRMNSYPVPIGKIRTQSFTAPSYPRKRYTRERKVSYRFAQKEGFGQLPNTDFIHLGGPQDNYYAEDALKVFKMLKDKLGHNELLVIRGFEPDSFQNESTHTAGIAMDIFVRTPEEAIYVADTAWLLGIRAIAIGPKFVHVDVGPEAVWGFTRMDIYRGPGTVTPGGLQYGFR